MTIIDDRSRVSADQVLSDMTIGVAKLELVEHEARRTADGAPFDRVVVRIRDGETVEMFGLWATWTWRDGSPVPKALARRITDHLLRVRVAASIAEVCPETAE